jgi:hypothetical protein
MSSSTQVLRALAHITGNWPQFINDFARSTLSQQTFSEQMSVKGMTAGLWPVAAGRHKSLIGMINTAKLANDRLCGKPTLLEYTVTWLDHFCRPQ